MKSHRYLWLAMAALGTATGLLVPKGKAPAAAASAARSEAPAEGPRGQDAAKELQEGGADPGPLPVSKDRMEDLLALEPAELYGRLGLWLLDASADDMAAFWKAYHEKGEVDMWIKDLVFTQWAKKDIDGMMAAAKRDKEEGPAWWAWTMSDPDAALAAMDGQPDSIRSYVLRGVANFHPERGMKMLQDDPSLARQLDLSDLASQVGRDDPQAAVELLVKYNSYDISKALRKWAKEDPRRALEWLAERSPDPRLIQQFAETVAQEDPKALEDLVAGMPSGFMKRELETKLFQQLAERDPDKAIEDARKMESPALAAQRLAQAGKTLMAAQPEKALETLKMIFEACPDVASHSKTTRYPQGATSSGGGIPGVSEFLAELTRWNPQVVMESVKEIEASSPVGADAMPSLNRNATWQVANAWLGKDPEGFTTWCEQQDEATFDTGASAATNFLIEKEDYAGAIAWAERIKDPDSRRSNLFSGVSLWASRDREAALRWYEQAELPEDIRTQLKNYFPEPVR